MACGTPVVCSNTSSLPEVAGDAALLVDPADVRALAGAMERALTDEALRVTLRARGMGKARGVHMGTGSSKDTDGLSSIGENTA